MLKRHKNKFAAVACLFALLTVAAIMSGCKSDAPQTLADQKAAVTGATAPPGALKAISDAQAAQGMQTQQIQQHAASGQAAAKAAAAAKPR